MINEHSCSYFKSLINDGDVAYTMIYNHGVPIERAWKFAGKNYPLWHCPGCGEKLGYEKISYDSVCGCGHTHRSGNPNCSEFQTCACGGFHFSENK